MGHTFVLILFYPDLNLIVMVKIYFACMDNNDLTKFYYIFLDDNELKVKVEEEACSQPAADNAEAQKNEEAE